MVLELCPHIWKSQELIPLVVNEALLPGLHSLHCLPQQFQFHFKSSKIGLKDITALKLLFSVLPDI